MNSIKDAKRKSHIIFGAGLIGCYLGGVLSSKGMDVGLICKPHIIKKLANGLKLTDYAGNLAHINKLRFVEKSSIGERCDFLWLTVKCTAIAQAAKEIKGFIKPETVIFCCQNGLGSEEVIKEHYPNNLVLRVMVPFNVAEIAPGHLHRGSEGTLAIEMSPAAHKEMIEAVAKSIDSDLMSVTTTNNMQALLWAKLQLNLGNSVNALADIPVKQMLEDRNYRLVIAAMMRELLAVTKVQNIQLPKVTAVPGKYLPLVLSLPNFLFKLVANKMLTIDPNVRTSMWWDLSQGKKTEIAHLNGAIVKAAEKLEIACPANKMIVSLIITAEKKNLEKVSRHPIRSKDLLRAIRIKR
ncbi:2-dehydropantoate 2-reductase [Sungkyunkwania multivorans]|uniref:2-dehydropantoate 2-reductase n=1 Tax=Sungkyunkwania multivorans TaxID=1173618 RepID=A0ABW3D2S3_9FLAO